MAGWEPPVVETDISEGPIDKAAEGVDMDWDAAQLLPDVIEEGNQLGQVIDVEDDVDNGGIPLDVPAPGENVMLPVDGLESSEPPEGGGQT
jgi:hypothetical protein